MAKGTLLASAKTTKKGGASITAKKAAIVGSTPATAATPAVSSHKKAKKSDPSSDGADVVSYDKEGNLSRKLRPNDPKYTRHYKEVLRESLEGMDLC